MAWRNTMYRASLGLGLAALVLTLWGGMHLQHLLDDEGSRHFGETVVALVLGLIAFAGSWYGARVVSKP